MNLEGVTVIIPTLNRESVLIDAIMDLQKQDYKNMEIIIVDQSDMASKKVKKILQEGPFKVNYYHITHFRGLPQARNFGWQKSKYNHVIFIDDDIRCDKNLVSEHMKELTKENVGAVAGGIDELNQASDSHLPTGRFNSWTATPIRGFSAKGIKNVEHVPGGNFSTKCSVLSEIHGFDEGLSLGAALYEETDFSLALKSKGYDIIFNGEARLKHLAVSSGGCREPDLKKYIWSLTRNRTMIIFRYCYFFQWPFAVLRMFVLVGSYTLSSRNLLIIKSAIQGFLSGLYSMHKRTLTKI